MTQNNLGVALRSARRAGERHGAARGGGCGLSRGAGGADARAGSARLGADAEQSRHCAPALGERESGARLERRCGLRRRCRSGRAAVDPTQRSRMRFELGEREAGRRGSEAVVAWNGAGSHDCWPHDGSDLSKPAATRRWPRSRAGPRNRRPLQQHAFRWSRRQPSCHSRASGNLESGQSLAGCPRSRA